MLEAIKNRRSVRFYKDEPVSDVDIAEVLKAGFCAPSSHNSKPWHVIVVKDQEIRDKLSKIHRWSKIIARVPVVLIVCVEKKGFDHFWIEDGAALMENMLIQASEMGLGTCWIGIRGLKSDEVDAEAVIREVCSLPENFGVVGITPIGYSSRYPGAHEPEIMEGRVHLDSFGNGFGA